MANDFYAEYGPGGGYRYGWPGFMGAPFWQSYSGTAFWRHDSSAPYWHNYRFDWSDLDTGPHTGRGPRSYQRSDERIREDVLDRLTGHGQVDASDMDVEVQNGEVTLSGTVDSRWAKRTAEGAAERVLGVRDVHNRLKVVQERWITTPSGRRQIGKGMRVVGRHGQHIGYIEAVQDNGIRVHQRVGTSVFVPFEACLDVQGNRVRLRMPAEAVNDSGWPA